MDLCYSTIAHSAVCFIGPRQGSQPASISSTAQSQPGLALFADLSSHLPDASSHSDSEPDVYDGAGGGDLDFTLPAKQGRLSRPFLGSKANLREKNKRAQKRFRARQKV